MKRLPFPLVSMAVWKCVSLAIPHVGGCGATGTLLVGPQSGHPSGEPIKLNAVCALSSSNSGQRKLSHVPLACEGAQGSAV